MTINQIDYMGIFNYILDINRFNLGFLTKLIRRFPNYRSIRSQAILCLGILLCCLPAYADSQGKFPEKGSRKDWNKAAVFLNQGRDLLDAGKVSESISTLQQANKIYSQDSMTYYNLGHAYSRQGNFKQAKVFYQKAINLEPDYANAWFSMANAKKYLKDLNGAAGAYKKAVQLNPSDPPSLFNYGSTLYSLGKYEDSKKAFQEFLRTNSDAESIKNANWYLDKMHSPTNLKSGAEENG